MPGSDVAWQHFKYQLYYQLLQQHGTLRQHTVSSYRDATILVAPTAYTRSIIVDDSPFRLCDQAASLYVCFKKVFYR